MTTVIAIATLVAATNGCLLLALSQRRHWLAVTQTASQAPRLVRPAGWGLIGISLVLVVMCDGISFGALFWPLITGVGALITAALLSLRPAFLATVAKFLAERRSNF
jgi:hypothetical protein